MILGKERQLYDDYLYNNTISLKHINKIFNIISYSFSLYNNTMMESIYKYYDISMIVNNICKIENPLFLLRFIIENFVRFFYDYKKSEISKEIFEMEIIQYLKCIKILGITLDDFKNETNYGYGILYYAYTKKCYELIIWLYQIGFNDSDINYNILHTFIYNNDMKAIKWLLYDKNLPLKLIRENKNLLLYTACRDGNLEMTKMIVNRGLKLKDIKSSKNRCFRVSVYSGHFDIVKYLRSLGLTNNDMRSLNNFSLRYAAYFGYVDIFKWLIEQGLTTADIFSTYHGSKKNRKCDSAIINCIKTENKEILKFIQERKDFFTFQY